MWIKKENQLGIRRLMDTHIASPGKQPLDLNTMMQVLRNITWENTGTFQETSSDW